MERGTPTSLWQCSLAATVLVGFVTISTAQDKMASVAAKIEDSLLSTATYDRRLRPGGFNESSGPVLVTTNLYIRSISSICDIGMNYEVQLTFRQQWRDESLAFDDNSGKIRYLNIYDPRKLWTPDTFFVNELESHHHRITTPNVLVRIYPDGSVLQSIRISLKLSCPMDFHRYPFDEQQCNIVIESYGYTAADLVLLWKKGDPVQITRNLYLPKFTLTQYLTDYCTIRTVTGEYSCLKVGLILKREFYDLLTRVYMPCIMLVVLSWIPLWLNNKNSIIRVLVPLVLLIVMANGISKVNQDEIPKTSYTKPIDVWTGICLTFVFAVVIFSTVVDYMVRREKADDLDGSSAFDGGKEAAGTSMLSSVAQRVQAWVKQKRSLTAKIDIVGRVAFPAVYVLFLIIYFSTYMREFEEITVKNPSVTHYISSQ